MRISSEGRGLSHDDKRSYLGTIEEGGTSKAEGDESSGERNTQSNVTIGRTLHVEGSVVFGTDLGTDARPEPVGKFTMKEISSSFALELSERDEEEDDDDDTDDNDEGECTDQRSGWE